jgi:PHP family Zn ribbon phosphoesterase
MSRSDAPPRRALSKAQAGRCEHAKTDRCCCRCGGAFHGKGRVADVTELPAEDPHHAREPAFRRGRPLAEQIRLFDEPGRP